MSKKVREKKMDEKEAKVLLVLVERLLSKSRIIIQRCEFCEKGLTYALLESGENVGVRAEIYCSECDRGSEEGGMVVISDQVKWAADPMWLAVTQG